jgi:signal transduction histidine kinase
MTTYVLRPFASGETYRTALFYLAELALGIVGFTLVIAGWSVTLGFAITPLVVPLLLALVAATGALARAHAAAARRLIGVRVHPSPPMRGKGFWGRGFAALRDPAFWRQQVYLLVAWPIALVPLFLLSWALQLLSLPIWYRWVDSSDVFGFLEVDTFGRAIAAAGIGLALLVIVAHLLRPFARFSRRLANRLLAGDADQIVRSPAETSARRRQGLTVTALVSAFVVLALIVTWALTTAGYFWPIWPLLSLVFVVAMPGWIVLALERDEIAHYTLGSRALAIQVGLSALLVCFLIAVWAITTAGYFWPFWPALGLALAAAVHGAVVYGQREHRIRRLEQTRAGAVDVQESELRRIERDLHDGAQARLVALGMNLGMAEQALDKDPEKVRELLAEARHGAGEALEELRDLARGIRPPILTDRGLEAAISALVARTPMSVTLSVDDRDSRYHSAVETAAYFTVAEALANAIKYAGAERIAIRIETRDGTLIAEVVDDGAGGADPLGRGLTGLRQRAEALDGRLSVHSPVGGPTTVRAELPCES